MKSIGIVTDSHSGISASLAKELGIMILPMPFYIDGDCYFEDTAIDSENKSDEIKTMTADEFYENIATGSTVGSSQPSPSDVMNIWDKALTEYEQILYIPISSGLSGSCSTAQMLAEDKKYKGKVFVVDNGRISALLHRAILDAIDLVDAGRPIEEIKETLELSRADMVIYVAVDDLKYLKAGGRISGTVASIGTMLNVKPVLKFDVSTLDLFKNTRGFAKARRTMIETLKEDLETKFSRAYEKDEYHILAASSASDEVTKDWLEEIKEAFPGKEILCDRLSMGVACHIGPGGLGIGLSCKPLSAAQRGEN